MILDRLFSQVSPEVARLLEAALEGRELTAADAAVLLRAEGGDFHALMAAADAARREDRGDDVSFVVNCNINFTNVCTVGCSFCGFSRRRGDPDAFELGVETVVEKARRAVALGATEVCVQGGIHPDKSHEDYREILVALRRELPDLHIHAFSPEEIDFGHRGSGMELADYLRWLMDAGLDTIPGTAAEILDDEIRQIISPRKLGRDRWVEIVKTAHSVGLRSSSTLMYGHVERAEHVADHLALLREIQKETGGFTEFVPLGFVHERSTLFHDLGARAGSSMPEDIRLVAVARLLLRPWIADVQVSWVKMGPKLAQVGLAAGANDFGGTLMEESISRESGAQFGEYLAPAEICRLIREVGRTPVERSTTYEILRRFDDPALDPPWFERARELSGTASRRLRKSRTAAAS